MTNEKTTKGTEGMTHTDAMDQLMGKVRERSTQTIFDCCIAMSGKMKTTEQLMARAALIEVYAEREGDAQCEALMDLMGI
jgi:hypothetical protein